MEDDVIRIKRQVCCRLCLAPDSECVSIFGTTAADKEPISAKIQSCVNIKIHESDRLSARICHMCISYLNSWQSYKNRCAAAQRRQKSWLAAQLKQQLGLDAEEHKEGGPMDADAADSSSLPDEGMAAYNYFPEYQRAQGNNNRGRTTHTGEDQESKDDEDTGPVTVNMELDPSQFLAGPDDDDEDCDDVDEDDEDDDGLEEGEFVENGGQSAHNDPQILNALGLRNVNMNPMSVLSADLMSAADDDDAGEDEEGVVYKGAMGGGGKGFPAPGSIPGTQCRFCRMGFSNRANARRHEKNIHGRGLVHELNVAQARERAARGLPPLPISAPSTPTIPPKPPSAVFQSPANTAVKPLAPAAGSSSRRSDAKVVDEEFDYSKPEKYRHLLTESRIMFIKRNARFLNQYQNMTCKCCNRVYFSYKTFMSHMRKKFSSLPRNVCYKCLRKFETKGQFIAHLKKRNCVNLFTLFMADPAIPKDAKLISAVGGMQGIWAGANGGGERLRLKDMLANKVYGCRLCEEQFRLKFDFRAHVNAQHTDKVNLKDPATGNCRHCQATFEDATERKRHFSNMDCLVEIICSTCGDKFGAHAAFLEHVYGTHLRELNEADERAALANSERLIEEQVVKREGAAVEEDGKGERKREEILLMPKKNAGCICPICTKQYNNYYNVLWHFESKHPEHVPKTYKCEICCQMFTKQALLKNHVQEDHQEAALNSPTKASQSGPFKCRLCADEVDRIAAFIEHQLAAHPDEGLLACHQCEFVTEERSKLEEHLRQQHLNLKLRVLSCPTCKQSFVAEDALKYHAMVQHPENENSEQLFKRMMKAGRFEIPQVVIPRVKEEPAEAATKQARHGSPPEESDDEDSVLLQDSSYLAKVWKQEELRRVRECPICVEKFPVLAEFVRHMTDHVRTDNVTNLDIEPGKSKAGGYHSRMRCRMCQRRISSKVGYKRHLLEEHQIEECEFVQCDLCPGEFSNEKGLKVHMFRTHNIKEDGEVVEGGGGAAGGPMAGLRTSLRGGAAALAAKEVQYECQICHTVYRLIGQLKSHVLTVHQINDFEEYLQQYGNSEIHEPVAAGADQLDAMGLMAAAMGMDPVVAGLADAQDDDFAVTDYTPIEVYFQCRYCDENFSSRQKLTAHMNTHDEHDPTDYTCKECGNVYQSRKSLWVHRNKKHPRSQVPSPCEICKKVFFDKTELVYHLKTHVAQKMELMNELMSAAQNGDLEEDDEDGAGSDGDEGEEFEAGEYNGAADGKQRYDCHVCNRRFRDPEKLSRHLRIHEMQNNMFTLGAFTEAGMDDGGGGAGGLMNGGGSGGDPFEPQYNEDGVEEYACDMCPKKFGQVMALRVHRGWHYRSPDGRQITEAGQTWQPGSLRSSRGSKGGGGGGATASSSLAARSAQLLLSSLSTSPQESMTGSTVAATAVTTTNNNSFLANHNLTQSSGATPLSGNSHAKLPKCQFCSSTFASSNNLRRHIVEVHKRNDWRAQTGGAGAGVVVDKDRQCQACSKTFETRAEWVEHKISHARVMRPSTTFEWGCEMCGKVFTRKERLLQHMASHATEEGGAGSGGSGTADESSTGGMERSGDDEEEEDDEEGEEDDDEEEGEAVIVNPDVAMEEDECANQGYGDEAKRNGGDGEKKPPLDRKRKKDEAKALYCDLCQVSFADNNELRRHITSHFINGVGVKMEIKKEAGVEEDSVVAPAAAEKATAASPEAVVREPQPKKAKVAREQDDIPAQPDEDEEAEVEPASSLGKPKQAVNKPIVAAYGDDEDDDDDDVDEGEYIEEYIDEESIAATTPAAPVVRAPPPQCRLCSTTFENTFKALKCMESHRQRSKYQCDECELYFATPKQLSGHQHQIHGLVA